MVEQTIKVASGLGDATPSQVLAGATFTSETGFKQEGTYVPNAADTTYDNTESGLEAGNVQDALDEINEKANSLEIAQTTDSTLQGSYPGLVDILGIHGKCEQDGEPTPDYPQEIKKSVVSGIRTHGEQLLDKDDPTLNAVINNSVLETSTAYNIYAIAVIVGNTYTLAKDVLETVSFMGFCSEIPTIGSTLTGMVNIQSLEELTFTATDNYLCLEFNANADLSSVMVNEGSTALPWKPYTESIATLSNPIELGGIGDVADVIYPANGYVERRFATVVFDGSDDELWTAQVTNNTAVSGKYRYTTRFLHGKAKGFDISVAANLLCTHYRAVPSNSSGTWGANEGMCIDAAGTLMVYDNTFNTSDISLWKAHLAANPMTVVYELAEPTTEALPIADQIALNSLKSFDGVTYVETDSEVKPTIEVQYGTSKVGALALENSNLREILDLTHSEDIKDLLGNFAEEYDSAKRYDTGDLCIYENKLYRYLGNTSMVFPSFDPTYWEPTTVSETINNNYDALDSRIADVEDELFELSYVSLAENLMPSNTMYMGTMEGISYSFINGVVSLNGKPSLGFDVTFDIVSDYSITLTKGTYCIAGLQDIEGVTLSLETESGSTATADYHGASFTVKANTNVKAYLTIDADASLDNVSFTPVLSKNLNGVVEELKAIVEELAAKAWTTDNLTLDFDGTNLHIFTSEEV